MMILTSALNYSRGILSEEASSVLGGGFLVPSVIIVKNPKTGNKVEFVGHRIARDSDGDAIYYQYRAERIMYREEGYFRKYDRKPVKLVLYND